MEVSRYQRLTSASDLVKLNWQDHNNLGLFYQPPYLRSFFSSLSADPMLVVGLDADGEAVSMVPAYKTRNNTYDYFHPGRLLHALFIRIGREDLAVASESLQSRNYFVAAIPFAYTSPFRGTIAGEIDGILDAFEKEAASDGISDFACLYYPPTDRLINTTLVQRGYLTTVLEANAVLDIDPSWKHIDDYFREVAGRRRSKERRVFCRKGYRSDWHFKLTEELIDKAVTLEAALLERKGTNLSQREVREWYLMVKDALPRNHVMLEVSHADGRTIATALFLENERTLIGKAIGIGDERRDYVYFNTAYYEPIRFAIEHGFKAIDYGPASTEAKRLRGATPRPLCGAFKFRKETSFVNLWPMASAALGRAQNIAWRTEITSVPT
jgi:hypothetical protein